MPADEEIKSEPDGVATSAKYFFVRSEPLHCAEALFETIY
jgi:hypothetical protein